MTNGPSAHRIILALAFLLAFLAAAGGDGTLLTAQEPEPTPPTPAATVKAENRQPAVASAYVVTLTAAAALRPERNDAIILTLHPDLGVPPVQGLNSAAIRISADQIANSDGTLQGSGTAPPQGVAVQGQDDFNDPTILTVFLGDMGQQDGVQHIAAGAKVTLRFAATAGLTNPTEGGRYSWTVQTTQDSDPVPAAHPDPLVRQAFGEPAELAADSPLTTGLLIDFQIVLSRHAAGRGDSIVAIARGFKNDTTLTFWRDRNFNGIREGSEVTLCTAQVNQADQATCDFIVRAPPFVPRHGDCAIRAPDDRSAGNCNLVNAIDGRGQSATLVLEGASLADNDALPLLELDGHIAIDFTSGQRLHIRLTHFPPGELAAVSVGGQPAAFPPLSIGDSGALNFSIAIPPDLRDGRQELRIAVTRRDNGETYAAHASAIIIGPLLTATPEQVRPNQRIHLAGSGFSIAEPAAAPVTIAAITIGSLPIAPDRINRGGAITVDSNGNWSAALDLPVNRATTAPGRRALRARDSHGRSGSVLVEFAPRELTIDPPWGRGGTTATVRGRHFPSGSAQGSGFPLQISYTAGDSRAHHFAHTDAAGNFAATITIPKDAPIPSTNQLRVEFRDADGLLVTTLASHDVPGIGLSLSPAAGPPGTVVSLAAAGFRPWLPVELVKVGSIEVTPAPRPLTDSAGRLQMQITVPGIAAGTQTVLVQVAGDTAAESFAVTPGGASFGVATPVAAAMSNLDGRFLRAFHFSNATKGWTFYDPAAAADSTLPNLISGDTYWLLVSETAETILNGKTRRLTCVNNNCWNLIVW